MTPAFYIQNGEVRAFHVTYLPNWCLPHDALTAIPGRVFLRRSMRTRPLASLLKLLAHEIVHLAQIERYGLVGFWLRYVWGLRKGYRNNPLEREAYLREDDVYRNRDPVLRGPM